MYGWNTDRKMAVTYDLEKSGSCFCGRILWYYSVIYIIALSKHVFNFVRIILNLPGWNSENQARRNMCNYVAYRNSGI